jgi:hypothetical protein
MAQRQVLHDRTAQVATGQHDPIEAELVMGEGVHVVDVGGHVVEAVGTDIAVAEAPQVGHHHVEAGGRQRCDDAPEDPLRLGPAVHADERHTADALTHVGLPEAAPLGVVHHEASRVDVSLDGHGSDRRLPQWIPKSSAATATRSSTGSPPTSTTWSGDRSPAP